jgi:tetratricopeptide (TPR) repeat protein
MEPKLRAIVGPLVRPLDLWWLEAGLGIGYARDTSAIAWELHWAPLLGKARWVVTNARGWGLSAPALAEALRVTDTLVGRIFERRGRVLWLEDAGRRLGRQLLPLVGARAPSASDVVFGPFVVRDRKGTVELDATFAQPVLREETTRVVELAELTRLGDDALASGDLSRARNAYLASLEMAPRQRDLVQLVAEIDLLMERTESALGLLSEAMPILASGRIGARLLLLNGEREAACELLAQAAVDERYAPMAALMLLARAQLETHGVERRLALDAAVAACPTLECARWARLEARAAFGDLAGAMADAQHLEAASTGRAPRHVVCKRSAEIFLGHGFEFEAGQLFQRALRYGPDDIQAMVGLARSLVATGEGLRAIPLLERAVETADKGGEASGQALVELAKLIATKLSDLPQAVARLRRISPSDPASVMARALEGRYRLMMGDVVGASLAYARMREVVELASPEATAAELLIEAARFERDVLRDPAAAERHLAVALRISPQHATVRELYREVSAVLAAKRQRSRSLATDDRSVPNDEESGTDAQR